MRRCLTVNSGVLSLATVCVLDSSFVVSTLAIQNADYLLRPGGFLLFTYQITKSQRTSSPCLGAPGSTSWVLSSRTRAVLRHPCCFCRIFSALSEHDMDGLLGILAEPFLCNQDGTGCGHLSGATNTCCDSSLEGGGWIYYQ